MPIALSRLNQVDAMAFVAVCGPVFEHSPWIADRVAALRPFATIALLHRAMCDVVGRSDLDQQLALIQAHPDLVGRLARQGRLTAQSTTEQAAAGLTSLSADDAETFDRFNAEYRERFGFPFIICARENRKDAILAAFPRRLQNDRQTEITTALAEIYKIARLRLLGAITES